MIFYKFEEIKSKYDIDAIKPTIKECIFVQFTLLLFLQIILFPTRGIPYYVLQISQKTNNNSHLHRQQNKNENMVQI